MDNKIKHKYVYSLISSEGIRTEVNQSAHVGRGANNQIDIQHKKISRNHAVLDIENDNLRIKDLGSSNGTMVNDQVITNLTALIHGDVIQFGDVIYTVDISLDSDQVDHSLRTEAVDPESINKPKIESLKEDIPDSWVEESTTAINGTRMMNLAQLEALRSSERVVSNNESNIHKLHCFIGDADIIVYDLIVEDKDSTQVWEIGRSSECDLPVKHPSVSRKHAQLIHQTGRWKIVNLVSTNGILINGQKKLSAFLRDKDIMVLGSTSLVFQTPNNNSQTAVKDSKVKHSTIALVISLLSVSAFLVWNYLVK